MEKGTVRANRGNESGRKEAYLKEEVSDQAELVRRNMARLQEQSWVHVCVLQAEKVGSAPQDSGARLLALL